MSLAHCNPSELTPLSYRVLSHPAAQLLHNRQQSERAGAVASGLIHLKSGIPSCPCRSAWQLLAVNRNTEGPLAKASRKEISLESLAQEVVRFIDQHIDSVDQLEILRIMSAQRSRSWGRDSLARALQAQPQVISLHLAALEQRGLLTAVTDQAYQFGPHADDIVEQVNCLLQLYNERPVTVIRAVYSKPRENRPGA